MGFELPISTRVTVRPGPQGHVVVVQARARLWSMLFLMGWLGMWSFAGFSIFNILASGSMKPGLSMFVMLWMVLWALGWLYGAANLLWMLAGEERLSISKTEVVKTVHTPILSRSWRYDPAHIGNVRRNTVGQPIFGAQAADNPLGKSGGVAFDYGQTTVTFGTSIDDAEARLIMEALNDGLGRTGVAA